MTAPRQNESKRRVKRQLHVWMTEHEYRWLRALAADNEETMSQALRRILRSCRRTASVESDSTRRATRLLPALIGAALASGLLAAPAPAQTPARDTRPAGTGRISGVVVAADSGRPLRDVYVSLRDNDTRAVASTQTNESGVFSFAGLSLGHYLVSAAKPGYLDAVYGQREPGSGTPGVPIALADGQRADHLALRLPRGGAIAGLVWDDAGEPAFRAQVRALRYGWRAGERALIPAGSAVSTDDRGSFRIAPLPPGQYVVMAVPRNAEVDRLTSDLTTQAAAGGGHATVNGASADDIRALMKSSGLTESTSQPAAGLAPIYYPGSANLASASPIALRIGQEVTGVDFSLPRVLLGRIAGRIGGTTRQGTSVLVYLLSSDLIAAPRTATMAADGQFSFGGVTPGRYRLLARSSAAPSRPGERMWGESEVTIVGGDTVEAALALRPAVSLSGDIVVEGGNDRPIDFTRLNITLTTTTPGLRESPVRLVIDASGRFVARDLARDSYRLSLSGTANGSVLKSAMVEHQDALERPLEVVGDRNIDGARLALSSTSTQLVGVVADRSGQPISECTVIAFPRDAQRWGGQSRRVRAVRSAGDGRYSITGLPAGEYRLIATTDVENGQWYDPDFLHRIENAAVSLTLNDGERKILNVTVDR